MAVDDPRPPDTRPATLQRIQTELMVVRAQQTDLKFKVRQRQYVERAKLKDATMRRALRVRDHLITAPARHAPLLAAEFGLPMETVHAALVDFMGTTLRWISAREYVIAGERERESSEDGEGVGIVREDRVDLRLDDIRRQEVGTE